MKTQKSLYRLQFSMKNRENARSRCMDECLVLLNFKRDHLFIFGITHNKKKPDLAKIKLNNF